MATDILARVPTEFDSLTEEVAVTTCISLGFTIERPRARHTFAIELGNNALVDGLPGLPGGSGYVGTFDREEALEEETLDFFASGHPLVERLLSHFEESALGRVAWFELTIGPERGEGLARDHRPRFNGGSAAGLGSSTPSAADRRAACRQPL